MSAAGSSTIDWSELGLVRHVAARPIPDSPQTVPEVIERALAQWPDREALVGRHGRYTYRALAQQVDAAASGLQALGLRPGDRVAATTANHTDIVIAYFAAQRLGAIWIGVNRTLAAPEKRFILEDSGANYYLAERAAVDQIGALRGSLPDLRGLVDMEPGDPDSGWAQLLREHRGAAPEAGPVDPFDPAAIAYTSGTTGFPKGVVHSQHNIVLVGAMARLAGPPSAAVVRRAGVALPITILNLMILGPVASFQAGRTCILMDRIDAPGLAEWIGAERIEAFAAVPTMIYDLMTHPEIDPRALESFRHPAVGGAAMPESFREFYRRKFGRQVSASYGLTEAPTVVTQTRPEEPALPGASGKPARHLRVSIQDPEGRILPAGESGEICVGAEVAGEYGGLYTPMLGYWRRPEATREALREGWLHTGDMGRLDEAGNLFVEGRRNDVILRGGSNVYPAEVERVLHMKGAVAEAAVIGRPDPRLGERVVAVIQLSPGATAGEALQGELEAHCRANLARYKTPEEWIFVSEMPRNAMNKVVKAQLKAQHFGSSSASGRPGVQGLLPGAK